MEEFIGACAGILTTVSFFPQVVKTVRTKSTDDLSAAWLIMMTTGVLLWIIYGLYLNSMPLIMANVVTMCCLVVLVWAKFFRHFKDFPFQRILSKSQSVCEFCLLQFIPSDEDNIVPNIPTHTYSLPFQDSPLSQLSVFEVDLFHFFASVVFEI
jgi:MtN3 and saliva related transmembrane protein